MESEFVKVPFKREADGSKTLFLPDCRRPKGYQVGSKKDRTKGPSEDDERYVESYWDALEELMRMETPRFRRRNSNGNAGIVKCAPGDVEEVRRDFIESERAKVGG